MSEEVRNRVMSGETLQVGRMKIPMIDLPLGATEDRVCGTIDIEKALTEGEWSGWGLLGVVGLQVRAGRCIGGEGGSALLFAWVRSLPVGRIGFRI